MVKVCTANWDLKNNGRWVITRGGLISKTRVNDGINLTLHCRTNSEAFIGLNYYNPPGGIKHCLNSKIAACKLYFKDKVTGKSEILETKNRAAFEILTNDTNHGITIAA
jgi:hypothetical protein